MKNSTTKKPFSAEALRWRRQLVKAYEIAHNDAAAALLLSQLMEAFDEMRQAQKLVDEHGQLVRDRWGQLKQNPATLVLRDSRNAMLKAFRSLNLDIEPPQPIGRPPGRR